MPSRGTTNRLGSVPACTCCSCTQSTESLCHSVHLSHAGTPSQLCCRVAVFQRLCTAASCCRCQPNCETGFAICHRGTMSNIWSAQQPTPKAPPQACRPATCCCWASAFAGRAHAPMLTSTLILLTAALSSSDFLLPAELGSGPLHQTGRLARRLGGPSRGSTSGGCSSTKYAQCHNFTRYCISAASI